MYIEYSEDFKVRVINLKPGSMNVMVALDMGELDTVKEHVAMIAAGNSALFIEILDTGDMSELRDYLVSMGEAQKLLAELGELVEAAELKAKYVVGCTN